MPPDFGAVAWFYHLRPNNDYGEMADDIRLFLSILFQHMPLYRCTSHMASMDPDMFRLKHARRFWRMLGANVSLHRWFVTGRHFLIDATQSPDGNKWKWPGFHMTLDEVEQVAYETTRQFAVSTGRRDQF